MRLPGTKADTNPEKDCDAYAIARSASEGHCLQCHEHLGHRCIGDERKTEDSDRIFANQTQSKKYTRGIQRASPARARGEAYFRERPLAMRLSSA